MAIRLVSVRVAGDARGHFASSCADCVREHRRAYERDQGRGGLSDLREHAARGGCA
jgi:hypothetical protein